MSALATELWRFFLVNVQASAFGVFLLCVFLVTELVEMPLLSRYDFIFLAAVGFQLAALFFGMERTREFLVILLFHGLATLMELFKTHPAIGSWTYPALAGTVFALGTVPLFTGFLYSAVGSYIARAFSLLRLSYTRMPSLLNLWILSFFIYANFFTHHFFIDLRYVLFAYACFLFYRTRVHFQVHLKRRSMPFLLTAGLTAGFVWGAENIGTFTNVWLYPSQIAGWHLISFHKIGSWFLLLILSFALVSIVYREKLTPKKSFSHSSHPHEGAVS